MNGAEYIVKFLENKGVDLVFGYPGGQVIFLYDVLGRSAIKHVLSRHEQGSIHAADGYARVTGRPGVCIATSGPGATNLVTGLANANMDAVPILAITGQVGLSSIGRDSFQEADITGITMPITKHSYLVRDINDLPAMLDEAWNVMLSGKPGPVLIDVPRDIFMGTVDFSTVHRSMLTRKQPQKNGLDEQLQKVIDQLKDSERPLLFVGGGIRCAKAWDELAKFVKITGFPVITSLMGKGALPDDNGTVLGMVGMHGKPAANLALTDCDLLIGLGVRFSDRVTGNPAKFLPNTKIIHVDIEPAEISKNVRAHLPVVCDAKKFLTEITKKLKADKISFSIKPWLAEIKAWQKKYPLTYEKGPTLKPQHVIEEVARQAGSQVVVATDVGQHQMFAAQIYPVGGKSNFITSGGLGTMGFGLPASIGASFGLPGTMVVLFTGDGSIQMNIQELATLGEHQLPVKIFILDNSCLGMVRQWQELFYNKHYAHSILTFNPDFLKLAQAYGIKALKITEPGQVSSVVADALQTPGPVLVACQIDREENVYPMIPPGGQPNEMIGRWNGETNIGRIG